jgi:hypothetical protein
MSWLTPHLTARVRSLKRPSPRPAPVPVPVSLTIAIEEIRAAMLAALNNSSNSDDRQHRLKLRIHHATDAQGLWALRGALMALLASDQGEARAVEKLLQLTHLFRNVLPEGLASGLDQHGHESARQAMALRGNPRN